MRRKPAKPTFKPYTQAQPSLIPPSWDELIPAGHQVRVVNRAVEQIDLEPLLRKYKGGGTSSYHPRMMLKVLVYAYTQRIYSSRQIAKGLRENVNFMWLSGGNRPDFRTINGFCGEKMSGVIEEVFISVLELLVEEGCVKLENYFVDGSKVEANANRHKVVWAKSRAKYQVRLREKVKELLKGIEAVNEAENEAYGDKDLEELGGGGEIDAEKLEKKIAELNRKAIFRSENFPYDAETDTFICPANQRLTYRGTSRDRTENGYRTELRHYQASTCNTCPLKPECTRAKDNRQMRVSFRLRPLGGWRRSKQSGVWCVLPTICENWRVDDRQFFCLSLESPQKACFGTV